MWHINNKSLKCDNKEMRIQDKLRKEKQINLCLEDV